MKTWILACVVAIGLLLPATVHAQVAFVDADDGGDNAGSGGITFTLDAGTDPDRFMFVFCEGDNYGGTDDLVATDVDFNGDQFSLTRKVTSGNADRIGYVFHLIAPDTGSHTVTIASKSHYMFCNGATYSGVSQVDPPTPVTNSSTASTGITASLTVGSSSWAVGFAWQHFTGTGFQGQNSTVLRAMIPTPYFLQAIGDHGPVTGSTTVEFDLLGSNSNVDIIGVELAPVGGGSTSVPSGLGLLGAGI